MFLDKHFSKKEIKHISYHLNASGSVVELLQSRHKSDRSDRKRRKHLANERILEKYNKEFAELSHEIPIEVLLKIGEIVCGSDHAICRYKNGNEDLVRRALRRCWGIGTFDHRETISRMVIDLYPPQE